MDTTHRNDSKVIPTPTPTADQRKQAEQAAQDARTEEQRQADEKKRLANQK